MTKRVLYIGDDALAGAACYLAGVMSWAGIELDYIANSRRVRVEDIDGDYCAFIVSDYPAASFEAGALDKIKELVQSGAGFFMPGGWDSYAGLNGGYNKSSLAEVLPVIMTDSDDRINSSSPNIVVKKMQHPILNSLDFDTNAPVVGGFNKFEAKPDCHLLLSTKMFKATVEAGKIRFEKTSEKPLLVVGKYGRGRVASLATDVAPHWVGGLVDWGGSRVNAQANGAAEIEVGNDYATLMANIVKWVGNFEL